MIVKKGVDPAYLDEFSSSLLDGFYLKEGETFDDALARAAEAFCYGDYELAQRVYEAAWNGWFMFASPILSNAPIGKWDKVKRSDWTKGKNISAKRWKGEREKGLPISCYSILAPDTIEGQMEAISELSALSVAGGGVGIHNMIRATTDKAPGPIPYMKVLDSAIGYYRQGRCYLPGTEVLTTDGWIPVEELTETTIVASVLEDGTIDFVLPNEIVREWHDGDMIRFSNENRGIDFHVTADHSMVIQRKSRTSGWGPLQKVRAEDVPTHNEARFVLSGNVNTFSALEALSPIERLRIAFQADGSNSKEWMGKTWISFHFAKQRKIDALRDILIDLKVDYTEKKTSHGTTKFYIAFPRLDKSLDWIDLDISQGKARAYLDEIAKWDSSVRGSGAFTYSSVVKSCADKVQALAVIAGRSSRCTPLRRETPRADIYTVYVSDSPYFTCDRLEKIRYRYSGMVYCATVDSGMLLVRNGSVPLVCGNTRRGACAMYMDVNHPDIIEHIKFRVPTGGDPARKADNRTQFHNAVNITDAFVEAVLNDDDFELVCPHTGEVKEVMKARRIWEEILEARALTGEPYILKIDTANRAMPQAQKDRGLRINGSNICNEIVLPTSEDRTFVCCLSSLNLEKWDEWKDTSLVSDLVRYLDNVIQWYIENAPKELAKSVFSASQERAIGIGTMGWHYYLQSKGIPFESGGFNSSIQHTHIIFKKIKEQAVAESLRLGAERGEAPDMKGTGRRNSHLMAVAPNSNNSIIVGTSPCIEPVSGNAYTQSTRAGSFLVKNPHLERLLAKKAWDQKDPVKWMEEQWKNIIQHSGSVQQLDYLTENEKNLFKTAFELDQHWVIEQADARQQHICQSQSLNLFFPAGISREYFNSVHLKALKAEYVKGLYYARMERSVNVDMAKEVERKALKDWADQEDCVSCHG